MEETNFYAYMYAQAATFAFDELAEVVDLTDPQSIQRAFISYLSDFPPPIDGIRDELIEEHFRDNRTDIDKAKAKTIEYEISIPGLDEKIDTEELKAYFEEFLEKIGAELNSESGYTVKVSVSDDERGGTDLNIFLQLKGKQVRTGANTI